MTLALIAALPFLGALLPGLMIRAGRDTCALVAGSFTALALLLVGVNAPAVLRGEVLTTRIDWLPQIGLAASFRLDGLALMFAGLILGIGLLIILYARYYLAKSDPAGQFFSRVEVETASGLNTSEYRNGENTLQAEVEELM